MRTVVEAIADAGGGSGTLTMLESGEAVSWREVHERARRMAGALRGHGLGPGSRVGLAGQTGMGLATALQAVWLVGGSITVLPPLKNAGLIAKDAGLAAVLSDEEVPGIQGALRISELLRQDAPLAEVYRPGAGDLAVLQYTSGSTRAPQGVPVTHGHLMSNVESIRISLKHDDWHPGQWVSWLPLYHDLGLIAFFILPMTCGCPLAIEPPEAFARNPVSWLGNMSKYRAVISGAPNFAYALMTRLLATGRYHDGLDLSAMRFLVSGGEPVDAEMMLKFAEAAGPAGLDPGALLPAYGLAEATLAATMTPAGAGLRTDLVDASLLESLGQACAPAPGSQGRKLVRTGVPVKGLKIRITERVSGEELPERRVGHVELAGPSVVGHYWGGQPDPSGWLRTGDLGYLTETGELVVCGRDKDVVFAAGRNIFPQDVEAVAQETPGVRPGGAAAFGFSDGQADRLVVAVESRGPDPDGLRRSVSAKILAEVGLTPKEVIVVPYGHLPKTTSGKLRRAEARRRYLAGELNGRQTR
jgi:fatty-acyl-CoA synthase